VHCSLIWSISLSLWIKILSHNLRVTLENFRALNTTEKTFFYYANVLIHTAAGLSWNVLTLTGAACCLVLPLPSCPSELHPRVRTCPGSTSTQVWWRPRDTSKTRERASARTTVNIFISLTSHCKWTYNEWVSGHWSSASNSRAAQFGSRGSVSGVRLVTEPLRTDQIWTERKKCSLCKYAQWRDWSERPLAVVLTNHITEHTWAVGSA